MAEVISIERPEPNSEWLEKMDEVHETTEALTAAWYDVVNAIGIAGQPWWPKCRPSITEARERLLFVERMAHERVRWALAELASLEGNV